MDFIINSNNNPNPNPNPNFLHDDSRESKVNSEPDIQNQKDFERLGFLNDLSGPVSTATGQESHIIGHSGAESNNTLKRTSTESQVADQEQSKIRKVELNDVNDTILTTVEVQSTEITQTNKECSEDSPDKPGIENLYPEKILTNTQPESQNPIIETPVNLNKRPILTEEMLKNVGILYKKELPKSVNVENIDLKDIQLDEKHQICKEILELEKKYSAQQKLNGFFSLAFENNSEFEKISIEKFEASFNEKKKSIEKLQFINCTMVKIEIDGLTEYFDTLFQEEFYSPHIKEKSANVYWEFLKIFVYISKDPIFSVILPEFLTFDLEKHMNYFKFTDELDIINIVKFRLILNTYRLLFLNIKKMNNEFMKRSVSIFVFNSRYYIRRYLICCLNSIWETNLLNLYIRITCYNYKKKFSRIEILDADNARHDRIVGKIEYDQKLAYYDHKETLMRLFFQFDVNEFRVSLHNFIELIKSDKEKNKILSFTTFLSYFNLYFFVNLNDSTPSKMLKYTGCVEDFICTFFKTFVLYVDKNEQLVNISISKYKQKSMMKIKNSLDSIKKQNKTDFTLKKEIICNKGKLKNFRTACYDFNYFLYYFEDESIINLIDEKIY